MSSWRPGDSQRGRRDYRDGRELLPAAALRRPPRPLAVARPRPPPGRYEDRGPGGQGRATATNVAARATETKATATEARPATTGRRAAATRAAAASTRGSGARTSPSGRAASARGRRVESRTASR